MVLGYPLVMPSGRQPQGDQPRTTVVSTKVTEDERRWLIENYGTAYTGLQAALNALRSLHGKRRTRT